jgi:hypothetical protein
VGVTEKVVTNNTESPNLTVFVTTFSRDQPPRKRSDRWLASVVVLAVDNRFLLDEVSVIGFADASADVRRYRVRFGIGFGRRVDGDGLFSPVGFRYLSRRSVRGGEGHGAP